MKTTIYQGFEEYGEETGLTMFFWRGMRFYDLENFYSNLEDMTTKTLKRLCFDAEEFQFFGAEELANTLDSEKVLDLLTNGVYTPQDFKLASGAVSAIREFCDDFNKNHAQPMFIICEKIIIELTDEEINQITSKTKEILKRKGEIID